MNKWYPQIYSEFGTVCGCETGCNTNRCICLKNGGLKCKEMSKRENVRHVQQKKCTKKCVTRFDLAGHDS